MSVKIGQCTNADVYLNGDNLVGRFKDFQLPDLEYKEVTHETLGQIAVLSMPGRPLQALKGKGTIDFLDRDLYPQLLNPTVTLPFALHSYVDVFNTGGVDVANSYRIVTNVTMSIRKVGGKPFKLGDAFEGEFEYVAQRFTQGVPGAKTPIVEVDVINQVHRILGQDVWPKF
ncbi:MAG: phage major tail tube protein [Hyphomicrobiales bacterium]|nr:phage major tail tube protein [Hyphomicrobiales bacterium]